MTPAERRKTEAALLALELASRRTLRRGLRLVTAHRALVHGSDIVAAAVAAGRDLEAIVAREVVRARTAAGVAGAKALRRELHVPAPPAPTPAGPYRTPWTPPGSGIDAAGIGRRAGSAYTERAARSSLQEAATALTSRIDTIAATETSAAFSQGRAEALRDVAPDTWLQWSAVLDRQTCTLCASLHGEVAQAGFGFRGYEPGMVHARCRCIAFPIRHSLRTAA